MPKSSMNSSTNNDVLIDCRPYDEYVLGHIQGACSIPATSLFERMHELPKRTNPIRLCGEANDINTAANYLLDRGHQIVEKILWSEALQEQLASSDTLELGKQSQQLWQAAPLLQRFVNELVPQHNIPRGNGLDIACGAGRDLAYLATQGWEMTGVDYSADSLERIATLAKYCDVDLKTQLLDMETGKDPFDMFEDNSFDLICVARYLHRPLFPYIKRLLKPQGVIIYQTFMLGCEKTKIGRPRNPNFLLRGGELAEIFKGSDILLDEIETLDDGRPVAAFVARL